MVYLLFLIARSPKVIMSKAAGAVCEIRHFKISMEMR